MYPFSTHSDVEEQRHTFPTQLALARENRGAATFVVEEIVEGNPDLTALTRTERKHLLELEYYSAEVTLLELYIAVGKPLPPWSLEGEPEKAPLSPEEVARICTESRLVRLYLESVYASVEGQVDGGKESRPYIDNVAVRRLVKLVEGEMYRAEHHLMMWYAEDTPKTHVGS